ncbi:N-acetylmuramoyl-L-alanine amidase [Actinokineospora sp. HUAS TT18]|uniref:N-acetylmuramoyl-L-alanine amidase n=1 Tax=Actinokineospora sp. HUAS TT18 TaxID=3447451 RepID=UPI003F51FB4A
MAALATTVLLPQQAAAQAPAPAAKSASAEIGLAGATAVEPNVREVHTDKPFSLVGVKWTGAAPAKVELRHREPDGSWAAWTTVDPATDSADVRRGSAGSEPVWTGRADTVQIRSADVARLTLVTVDPGADPAKSTVPRVQATPDRPAVVTRAEWGADESLMGWPAEYASTTKAVSIHHTAGTNDYTCAESASLIRAIYRYHAIDMDWGDIGYSALVDKCGTVFEGRTGGLQYPTIGAHTGGFNTYVFGISMLGTFTSVPPSDAQHEAVSRIAAWKLGGSYRNPLGTTQLTSKGGGTARWPAGTTVTLPVIFGHRDSGFTECPGDLGYANLGNIRTRVATLIDEANTWNSPIYQKWNAAGGDNSFYGGVYEVEAPLGDGRSARFESGNVRVTSHPTHGTRWFSGAVQAKWLAGGAQGIYGWPTADQTSVPIPGGQGVVVPFSNDYRLYYSGATGAVAFWGTWSYYFDSRSGTAKYGVPIADPVAIDATTYWQDFTAGYRIYQIAGPGLVTVEPPIRAFHAVTPNLGLPANETYHWPDGSIEQRFTGGNVLCTPGGGCAMAEAIGTRAMRQKYNEMGGGGPLEIVVGSGFDQYAIFTKWGTTVAITWNKTVGAHWFSGAIYDKWNSGGRSGSAVADQSAIGSVGAAAAFDKDYSIYFSGPTGAHRLSGLVRQKYWELGHTTGIAGYPTSDVADAGAGGQFADFQNLVSIYASPSTGGHWISGALRQRYRDGGGPAAFGLPTSDQYPTSGPSGESGLYVLFGPNRVILWTASIGAKFVHDGFLSELRSGGDVAAFGFPGYEVLPITGTTARFQQFARATVFERETNYVTLGWALRDTWWASGGVGGPLGLPASDITKANGIWRQSFDHGTVQCTDLAAANTCQVTVSG